MLESFSQYLNTLLEYLMSTGNMSRDDAVRTITVTVISSLVVAVGFYVLKAVATCLMAKKQGIKKWWLGALPYFNYAVIGKLCGPVRVFGFTIKNMGLIAAIFLFVDHMIGVVQSVSYLLVTSVGQTPFTAVFYQIMTVIYVYFSNAINLVYFCAFLFTCFGLFGKYAPDKRILFTCLSIFQPIYAILLLVIRNRKPYASFDDFVKQKMAERFGQSYDPYSNPYETHENPFLNEKQKDEKDDNPFDEY